MNYKKWTLEIKERDASLYLGTKTVSTKKAKGKTE